MSDSRNIVSADKIISLFSMKHHPEGGYASLYTDPALYIDYYINKDKGWGSRAEIYAISTMFGFLSRSLLSMRFT